MSNALIVPGRLVLAHAGRDKGSYFLVWRVIDDHFVELVDGKKRKVNRPKRKKIKHIQITEWLDKGIARAIAEGKSLNDLEIRETLAKAGYGMKVVATGKEDGFPNVETGRH